MWFQTSRDSYNISLYNLTSLTYKPQFKNCEKIEKFFLSI